MDDKPIFQPLIKLLERWAERESIRTDGKACNFIPELTYKWGFNPIDGVEIQGEGYCTERSTTPYKSDDNLDEFGVAFRNLTNYHQALIIVGHFGKKQEWEVFIKGICLPDRVAKDKLREAWLCLWELCWRRDLL